MFRPTFIDEAREAPDLQIFWSSGTSECPASVHRPGTAGKTIKRAFDIVGALTFFLLFGLLYVAVAWCVWLEGAGPIHYRQTRLGRNGKSFDFYKFRSMVVDANRVLEELLALDAEVRREWETFQKLKDDPRILPIGKFLRRFSLDELPQFWNVLRGDMSLVGPRPCMEGQRRLYGDAWNHYATMRPGLTGLWQVSRRGELTFAQRVQLDVEYVNRWSLWMDLKILTKTVRAVIFDGE